MRGNPKHFVLPALMMWSIPARAGEPFMREQPLDHRKVYPRACGGTSSSSARSMYCLGLSPRVRGNPSARVGYRDTSSTAFYSWKGHLDRPPCAE